MARRRLKRPVCPNCETPLPAHANFCPNCGQENHSHTRPFGHLLYEFVESITHFDAKLWATLKAIVTRPGQFVVDFVSDRRARYVPPARLYVFVSVIFFLLVNKYVDKGLESNSYRDRAAEMYGPNADYFTLGGLYGSGATQVRTTPTTLNRTLTAALDATQKFPIYYDTNADPKGIEALRQLKAMKPGQLDSLVREFYQGEDFNPGLSSHFREMVRQLPDRLPARYYRTKIAERLVPIGQLVNEARLDSLSYLEDIYLPFLLTDSTGTQSLKDIKTASDGQLLDIYRLSHPILAGQEKNVLADMRRLLPMLPDTHSLRKSEGVEYTLVSGSKPMRFDNDSIMKATIRQTRYMRDDDVLRLIEKYSGGSTANWSWWQKVFVVRSIRQSARLSENVSGMRGENVQQLIHVMVKYISWTMFLLMPIVAFMLLILYYRRQKFYYEHLIFSVHLHTVFFLIFSLCLLIAYYTHWDTVLFIGLLLGYIYLLLAQKRTYGQGWVRTILKFGLFTFLYGAIFALATTVVSVLGFLNF